MQHRNLFPRYPAAWARHPEVLDRRVGAIEDHLEQEQESHPPSNFDGLRGLFVYIPALILWLCGVLGLVLPEWVANALKAMGHG